MYDYLRHQHEGKIFIDYDNPTLREISEGITSIFYGKEDDLFVSGQAVANNPFLKLEWKFVSCINQVQTQLIGEYNLPNALAAISIGKYFGVKKELINKALEIYEPKNNRSQLKKTDRNMLIIDAYNANPSSMLAALKNFSQMEVKSKVLILGDMRELGEDGQKEHQKIADYVDLNSFDQVFFIGDNFSRIQTTHPCYKNLDDFKEYLTKKPLQHKYILIKGSRGLELEKCVELL